MPPTNIAVQSILDPTTYQAGSPRSTVNLNNNNVRRHVLELPVVREWDGTEWQPPPEPFVPVEGSVVFPPGLTTRLVDTFTRSGDLNGSSPDFGPIWSSQAAQWNTNGSQATHSSLTYRAKVVVGRGDVTVNSNINVNSSIHPGGDKSFYFFFKSDGANVFLYCYVNAATRTTGVQDWALGINTGSGLVRLATGPALGLAYGAAVNCDVAISCVGHVVTATVNGKVCSVVLTAAQATALVNCNAVEVEGGDILADIFRLNDLTVQTSTDPAAHTSVVGVTRHIGVNPIKRWQGAPAPHWETLWTPS